MNTTCIGGLEVINRQTQVRTTSAALFPVFPADILLLSIDANLQLSDDYNMREFFESNHFIRLDGS